MGLFLYSHYLIYKCCLQLKLKSCLGLGLIQYYTWESERNFDQFTGFFFHGNNMCQKDKVKVVNF